MSNTFLLSLLVVAVALPNALCAPCANKGAVEIDSSVRVYSDIDWKYNCHTMVEVAKTFGGTRINYIPTHFFIDNDGDKIPDGYRIRMGRGQFVVPTAELLEQYKEGMTACFRTAIKNGFSWIEITPHLDDADAVKDLWRNEVKVSPFEEYGGLSYVQLLIDPLIDAISAAGGDGLTVHMSIQGEMNAVLINYPAEWTQLISYMRRKFDAGGLNAKIGINNNFNKICAECPVETNWAPAPGQFDLKLIGKLYDASDFIAISAYAPVDASFPKLAPADLENSINVFATELEQFDVSLADLLKAGKGFHYSEFGLGGGIGDGSCKSCPVTSALEAAKYPFQGIGGAFNPKKDPWAKAETRDYMEKYYRVTTQFAAKGTGTGKWNVDAIFIWNAGSYDVQAVYPASTVRSGSYRNEVVVKLITDFNTKCTIATS